MDELRIGEILLEIALLMSTSYLLGGLLVRLRIPVILGALLIAMAAHYSPLGERLLSPELAPTFQFLGDLGVLFLLFFIGLQIDLDEMRAQSRDIIWATVLNTVVPFLLGMLVMLVLHQLLTLWVDSTIGRPARPPSYWLPSLVGALL